MNREINFNAWIPELGYMLEDVAVGHGSIGFPSDDEDFEAALKAKGFDPEECNIPDWLYDTGEDWYQITEPEHFVLLQFTGLKDKNGKDINEGDIIHLGDKNIKYVVEWHDCGLSGRQLGNKSRVGLSHWQSAIEVISNRYQDSKPIQL